MKLDDAISFYQKKYEAYSFPPSQKDIAEDAKTHHDWLTELRDLREWKRQAVEVLKKMEWSYMKKTIQGGDKYPACPTCEQYKIDGHAKDCALYALLQKGAK